MPHVSSLSLSVRQKVSFKPQNYLQSIVILSKMTTSDGNSISALIINFVSGKHVRINFVTGKYVWSLLLTAAYVHVHTRYVLDIVTDVRGKQYNDKTSSFTEKLVATQLLLLKLNSPQDSE
jgi:hypothetical protein